MNTSLMTIVLESLAFFELAGDDMVDPDIAVEQLQGAAQELGRLSAAEKAEFVQFALSYADAEAAQKGPPERIEYFRTVPENMGLVP